MYVLDLMGELQTCELECSLLSMLLPSTILQIQGSQAARLSFKSITK